MQLTAELVDRVITGMRLGISPAAAPRLLPQMPEQELGQKIEEHAKWLASYDCIFSSEAFNSMCLATVAVVALSPVEAAEDVLRRACRTAFVYGIALGRYLQSAEDAEAMLKGT